MKFTDKKEKIRCQISGVKTTVMVYRPGPSARMKEFIERYSRQMLVSGISLNGQRAISSATVLIVGAGGLGCPVAIYLAAAGVGRLKICDGDVVEESNLPRQVLHKETSIGVFKADSVASSLREINSKITVEPISELVTPQNVLSLMRGCQVVVDATDNVVTRYLLNDAAAICKIPLVSGAALGWDGQVSVFCNDGNGPCYRCLYPEAPPPAAITNCDLGGVIGPVTGLIGSLQALQVLRLLAGLRPACTDSLFTFSGDSTDKLTRHLKLRPRRPDCIACGDAGLSAIYDENGAKMLLDYSFFCHGARADDKNPDLSLLVREERISCKALNELLKEDAESLLLIDVRPANQFEFCKIDGSISMPIESFSAAKVMDLVWRQQIHRVILICRRGNDSQLAVRMLQKELKSLPICDLIGGLRAWAQEIDSEMPIY